MVLTDAQMIALRKATQCAIVAGKRDRYCPDRRVHAIQTIRALEKRGLVAYGGICVGGLHRGKAFYLATDEGRKVFRTVTDTPAPRTRQE